MSVSRVAPSPRASRPASATSSLRTGFILSSIVHGALVAAVVVIALQHDAPRPPVYRVEMIAGPAGTRQAGVVQPEKPAEPAPAAAPAGAERAPVEKALPTKKAVKAAPVRATPSLVKTRTAGAKEPPTVVKPSALPTAGSGQTGGKGSDVISIDLKGTAFPYEGYLKNIVREISLAYSSSASASLVAEVKFIIHRNGSVTGIEIVKPSGNRFFDIEAKSTIEAVRNFGPLPSGWADDVLVVYFTFDYTLRP